MKQDLLEGGGKKLNRLAGGVRKIFPRFMYMRTLMVGCAAGEGHLDGDDNGKAKWVANSLHAALKQYAGSRADFADCDERISFNLSAGDELHVIGWVCSDSELSDDAEAA